VLYFPFAAASQVLGEEPFTEGNPASRLSVYKGTSTARVKAPRSVQCGQWRGPESQGLRRPYVMKHAWGHRPLPRAWLRSWTSGDDKGPFATRPKRMRGPQRAARVNCKHATAADPGAGSSFINNYRATQRLIRLWSHRKTRRYASEPAPPPQALCAKSALP
jgi:hypothetical protein